MHPSFTFYFLYKWFLVSIHPRYILCSSQRTQYDKRKLCYYMFYANVSSLARDYDYAIFKGSGCEHWAGVSSKHYEMPANTGMLIEVPGTRTRWSVRGRWWPPGDFDLPVCQFARVTDQREQGVTIDKPWQWDCSAPHAASLHLNCITWHQQSRLISNSIKETVNHYCWFKKYLGSIENGKRARLPMSHWKA